MKRPRDITTLSPASQSLYVGLYSVGGFIFPVHISQFSLFGESNLGRLGPFRIVGPFRSIVIGLKEFPLVFPDFPLF